VRTPDDVRRAVAGLRAGEAVRVTFVRHGRERTLLVRTMEIDGRVRLGVVLAARPGRPRLAVPVRYAMGEIGGSSGGLMMALRIYDALHGIGGAPHGLIAGTGTLDYDGRVGPIRGTPQKLIAAKRAGATVFFVPRENYADIAGERDIRIVPVGTFADALRALERLDGRRLDAVGERFEAGAVDRFDPAAVEFDGVGVLEPQQRARRHVAHGSGRGGDLRLGKVAHAG
jgi:PDZ domain-containing protein